ncbi:MAG: ABC transporter ATP-binding protein [Candidatus Desulforudis sp.]|nr:ABC transporter ATP-binding protein [Desulforudis sp.]
MLEVQNVRKHFRSGWLERRTVKAVDGVSFTIAPGCTLGLVGESGVGKSTVGRLVAGLLRPTAGSVCFEDLDVFRPGREKARYLRRKIQIVFQNPEGALNPRMRVGEILAEPLQVHRLVKGRYVKERVAGLLEMVGLGPEFYHRYPWEMSGGQNQRVAIARALSVEPSLLVLDEPTSALDVSVQAQILQLLKATQRRMKLCYLFISHDLDVIYHMADEIAIMHRGRLVEQGPAASVIINPRHSYTVQLLSAKPALPSAQTRNSRVLCFKPAFKQSTISTFKESVSKEETTVAQPGAYKLS